MTQELRGLSEDEKYLINHIGMWGSSGYPINKVGRGWIWSPVKSVKGSPIKFKTKKEAVDSFEAYFEMLLDANAGRI